MKAIKTRRLKTFTEFCNEHFGIGYTRLDETTFYVYRTDTNAVIATNIDGFEAAKETANRLRRKLGLKWDEVKFKKMGGIQGRSFVNNRGESYRIEYSPRVNPSKGRRFRGYTDAQGNYHDID